MKQNTPAQKEGSLIRATQLREISIMAISLAQKFEELSTKDELDPIFLKDTMDSAIRFSMTADKFITGVIESIKFAEMMVAMGKIDDDGEIIP